MSVPSTFAPNTIIKSAQVNTNNTYITDMIDLDGTDIDLKPANTGDVVVFNKMPRRNHAGNTYVDSFIQRGWGYVQGDDSNRMFVTVTLPKLFSSAQYSVVSMLLGVRLTGDGVPTDESKANATPGSLNIEGYNLAANQFQLSLEENNLGSGVSSTVYYIYNWIAMGPI